MNEMIDAQEQDLLPPTSASFQILKAQIDVAVSTARAYPRRIHACQQALMELIRLDEETAEECIYRLERKKRGPGGDETVIIQGPSIRFAELLAASWGHLRIEARIIDEGKDFITVAGSCHDLFSNVYSSSEVARRITNSRGRRFSADMIQVTAAAAGSIAKRNAILGVVPQPLWRPAFNAVIATVTGNVGKIAEKRMRMIGNFALIGVPAEAVLKKVGRAKLEEVTPDDMVRLFGIMQGIKEDQTSVAAEFGSDEPEEAVASNGSPLAAAEDEGEAAAQDQQVDATAGKGRGAEKPSAPNPGETPPAPAKARSTSRTKAPSRQDKDAEVAGNIEASAAGQAEASAGGTAASPEPGKPSAPKEPVLTGIEKTIADWEIVCGNAPTIAALNGTAANYGPAFDGKLTPEQEERVRAIYDTNKTRIEAAEQKDRRDVAVNQYESAKRGDDQPSGQGEATGEGASSAPEADGDESPEVLKAWQDCADLAPDESKNPDAYELWRSIIKAMALAPDQEAVNAVYSEAEERGEFEMLPEEVALNMRTARYKIRKLKA